MIKSLVGKNFQSHKQSSLSFCDGVNVIVGTSDSGKSSLLRMLWWLRYNRPVGTSIIRIGETNCQVTATLEHGGQEIIVGRERTKSVNNYVCGIQEFKTVGRDVPEDVVRVMNLTDINIQRQVDYPFLVLETPGQIAQVLNEYTKLDDVDVINSDISGSIRKLKAEQQGLQMGIEEARQGLEGLVWVDELEPLVVKLEAKDKALSAVEDTIDRLDLAVANTETAEVALENAVEDCKALGWVDQLDTMVTKLEASDVKYRDGVHRWNTLDTLINQAKAAQERIAASHLVMEGVDAELKKCDDAIAAMQDLDDVRSEIEQEKANINHRWMTLKQLLKAIGEAESNVKASAKTVAKLTKDLTSTQKELSNLPDCPMCGYKLTDDRRKKVLDYFGGDA